jgi:acetyl esterase/lipase
VNSSHGKVETHWLGTPDAEAVILYFHGGAYTQPASAGHFAYLSQLVQDLNSPTGNSVKSNCRYRSLSILVLAYSLAPEATHPTQLAQASAVLSHLTKTRSASSIFLSGDSAGGNLALGLLTHVLHPHPAATVVKLKEPLAGVLVYSPWAGFSTRYKSYESNETLDMLAPVALRKWSAMFLGQVSPKDAEADPGHVSGDEWTDVVRNDAEWWEGLHSVVDGVFVAYGGNEVLRDPIRELEGKVRSGWVDGGGEGERIVFLEARGEAHVQPIVDFMTPGKGKSETQRATEEWYMARLRM